MEKQGAEKHAQCGTTSGEVLHRSILCVCVLCGSEGTHTRLLSMVTSKAKRKKLEFGGGKSGRGQSALLGNLSVLF